jgi:mRNA interferase MazF
VLWLDGLDAMVAAVTSAPPRSIFDVSLVDWKAAGLLRASTVRLARLDCLEQALLCVRIGALFAEDGRRIQDAWAKHIKPQF